MVALSTVLGIGQLALGAFSGMQASKAAKKSAAQTARLTDAQIEALNRANEIGDAGGAALQIALGEVLSQLGSRGQYDPEKIDDLASLLAEEADLNEVDVKNSIRQAMVQAGGRSNQQLVNALNTARSLFKPTAEGMTAAQSRLNPNAYDATVAANAQAYAGMLDKQTQSNLDAALSRITAGRYSKMGGARSGAEIAAATMAAESASKQQAENQLRAIDMAMKQAAGLQGLSTGLQAGNINAQKMQMNIADMQFKQAIDSLTAGQTARSNAQGMAANEAQQAIAQLTAQNALNQNKDLAAYQQALNLVGAEQGLRGNLIAEVQNLVTAPYTYRMAGPQLTAQTAPAGAKASIANTSLFANQASDAFNMAGQQLDKLLKNNTVQSPTLSSSANAGSFAPTNTFFSRNNYGSSPFRTTSNPVFGV